MASERYRIELRPAAVRDLESLDKGARARVARKIEQLAGNPRPPKAKKLVGEDGIWRVRAGDYRILYLVEDARLIVLVIRIGHRREVYR